MLPALARRGVYVPKVTVMAALSTQAEAAVSAAFNKAKWHDVADEVDEISHHMREGTTNHCVDLPSPSFERKVDTKLQGAQRLVESRQHNEAFSQVHSLKGLVKDELYHHRQEQRKAFSTMTDQHVDNFEHEMHELKWFDVEGDLEEIHLLMHEATTNHAINSPDIELEQLVEKTINDIKEVIAMSPRQHKLVYGQIHKLKAFVKDRLYNGHTTSQAHVLAFEKEMEALKWSDIKDEVECVHQYDARRQGPSPGGAPAPERGDHTEVDSENQSVGSSHLIECTALRSYQNKNARPFECLRLQLPEFC